MSRKYLVGVDGSEAAERAAEFAADRAEGEGAVLLLMHVVEWSGFEHLPIQEAAARHDAKEAEIAAAQETILDPLVAKLAREGLRIDSVVRHGHAAETIYRLAESGEVDQVFSGRRGRSKIAVLLLGSVTMNLIQSCPVPVTIVP